MVATVWTHVLLFLPRRSRVAWRFGELAELELAYAPPYGSAKDPVNLAGMAAQNALDGDVSLAQWHEVVTLDPAKNAPRLLQYGGAGWHFRDGTTRIMRAAIPGTRGRTRLAISWLCA